MSRTLNDAIVSVKQQWPPGDELLYAWDDPSSWVAHDIREKARALLALWGQQDKLRRELVPQTAVEKLTDWENLFAVAGDKLATYASDAGRQARIVSRWREHGASSIPNISAALAAVTGPTPGAFTIIEQSRSALTAANTHAISAIDVTLAGNADTVITFTRADNSKCSSFGMFLKLSLVTANREDLTYTLTSPDSVTKHWPAQGSGPMDAASTPFGLFGREFAGAQLDGAFTFTITSNHPAADTLKASSSSFAEGIGRDASGAEGLASSVFEWAVLIDESLVTPATYDRALAKSIVDRWRPAHTRAYLVIKSLNGDTSGVWGDPTNSLWDGCLWG